MSRILLRLCLCTVFLSNQALGQTLSTTRISLGHPANGDVERIGHDLAVSGVSAKRRWLSLIGLGDFEHMSVSVAAEVQLLGHMNLAGHEWEQPVYLSVHAL